MDNLEFNVFDVVKTILVVDDKEENRVAAKTAISELFPGVTVIEAASAEEARTIIIAHSQEIDFVFSDMQMEEDVSGFYVAFEAWSRYIPTIVVTAGDHHGSYVQASGFARRDEKSHLYSAQPARKDEPKTWKGILESTRERNDLSLRVALMVKRQSDGHKRIFIPDAGEILARLTCSGMGNIRDCKVPTYDFIGKDSK